MIKQGRLAHGPQLGGEVELPLYTLTRRPIGNDAVITELALAGSFR